VLAVSTSTAWTSNVWATPVAAGPPLRLDYACVSVLHAAKPPPSSWHWNSVYGVSLKLKVAVGELVWLDGSAVRVGATCLTVQLNVPLLVATPSPSSARAVTVWEPSPRPEKILPLAQAGLALIALGAAFLVARLAS
jgi:hypothetical protein